MQELEGFLVSKINSETTFFWQSSWWIQIHIFQCIWDQQSFNICEKWKNAHALHYNCKYSTCSTGSVHMLNWKCAHAQLIACTCSNDKWKSKPPNERVAGIASHNELVRYLKGTDWFRLSIALTWGQNSTFSRCVDSKGTVQHELVPYLEGADWFCLSTFLRCVDAKGHSATFKFNTWRHASASV